MFYLHPWELDPDQPRPPMAWHLRFRHYVGIVRDAAKLGRLLSSFRFSTTCHVNESKGLPISVFLQAHARLVIDQPPVSGRRSLPLEASLRSRLSVLLLLERGGVSPASR